MKHKVNWVLVCYTPDEEGARIHHMCAYEEYVDDRTKQQLADELAQDPEFGMTDMVYMEDYFISAVPRDNDTLRQTMDDYGVPYEFETGEGN